MYLRRNKTDKIRGNYSKLARYKNLIKYRKLSQVIFSFDFSKARKSNQKVGNNMTLSDFRNGYISVFLYSRFICIFIMLTKYVNVAQQ